MIASFKGSPNPLDKGTGENETFSWFIMVIVSYTLQVFIPTSVKPIMIIIYNRYMLLDS